MKSDSPVICFSGRTSTPSARMSTANAVMPACFFTSGSVRARHSPQSANWAYDVHTFWPDSRQPPSSRTARVDSEARSLPAPGSLNSWQKRMSARRIDPSQRRPLLVGAVGEEGGPDEVDRRCARPAPGRGPGPAPPARRSATSGPAPRPPTSAGHVTPTQRASASRCCHVATEGDLLVEGGEPRRQAGAVLPRQVLPEPGPALGPDLLLLGGRSQVHPAAIVGERT